MNPDLPTEIPVVLTNAGVAPLSWNHRAGAPRVSCLMVTRGRGFHVRQAIAGFLAQVYPIKELLVVTEAAEPALLDHLARLDNPDVRLVTVGDRGLTLGELRNAAVDAAGGELVCQWDDDDLYDPERLSTQVCVLMQTGAHACLMQRWLMWWPQKDRLAVSTRRFWEGSLLAVKSAMPRYPALRHGEDTPVVEQLLREARVASFDLPQLYVYTVHGSNTFTDAHFEQHWDAATARYTGSHYTAVLDQLARRLPGLRDRRLACG